MTGTGMLASVQRPADLIRFQRPELPPLEAVAEYFRRSEEIRWFSNGGPCAIALAERVGDRLGGDVHVVPVASATAGLVGALRGALGKPGDAKLVITPSYTFTATGGAIRIAGYEPLFVDVDPRGWQLDPELVAGALDAHAGEVAGVLACANFGTAPAPEVRAAWRAACARHGVPLLLDSAPGFGSLDIHGRPLGGLGDTEVFSFHATKTFAIGEGGAVVTPDAELAERVTRLINFGLKPGTRISTEDGFNGKLSELHAAVGLAALDRFDDVLARRRSHVQELRRLTAGTGLTYQAGAGASTWQYLQCLAPDDAAREAVLATAAELAVEVRTLHDPPLHRHPAYADARRFGSLAVTEALAARSLSLPIANDLTEAEIERIAAVPLRALG
jgi:dTDP-4-amino-4,6-dideoxygalactose transaminase